MIILILGKNKNQIKGDDMLEHISVLSVNYVRLPNYMYGDVSRNDKKVGKKLTFSTKETSKVSFHRKMFSEKRGRVIKK
jgi:hypothetical protein